MIRGLILSGALVLASTAANAQTGGEGLALLQGAAFAELGGIVLAGVVVAAAAASSGKSTSTTTSKSNK